VSPSPEIRIQVDDDNPHFLLDNPNLVELFFYRERQPVETIDPTDSRVEFVPAADARNKAQLYFRPQNLEDGIYVLEVQSYDRFNNASGPSGKYKIRFEVVNRNTVTQVVNYPNPFSTSTRFVYRLTGSALPEKFELHIYTVSGRLVKVIDFVELGEVAVGQHTTTYTWDGTDEFGDRLANGVYLYRTVLKMPTGTTTENHNPDNLNRFFDEGWGKMVIMR
jgi:hypothetical protein